MPTSLSSHPLTLGRKRGTPFFSRCRCSSIVSLLARDCAGNAALETLSLSLFLSVASTSRPLSALRDLAAVFFVSPFFPLSLSGFCRRETKRPRADFFSRCGGAEPWRGCGLWGVHVYTYVRRARRGMRGEKLWSRGFQVNARSEQS